MPSATHQILKLLRRYESRNVTYIDPDGAWPIIWERAQGNHVWDIDGRRYLDLTAAFGVAAVGHGNRQVVRAGQEQMSRLLHAMGDVHPHALKANLARELSRITFERWSRAGYSWGVPGPAEGAKERRWGKSIFCNSGFEAVEAALKTALLATGKSGVIAFKAGYHGLGYGALNATHRTHFRRPFLPQLARFGQFVDFPATSSEVPGSEKAIRALLRGHSIGAILVEPVQVRGGVHVAPTGFLPMLRRVCREFEVLLILDEIYTGFGRTGKWFGCEHWQVAPDLICLGKALTGGFPLSVCVGESSVMDRAWPESSGEAIHTSTYLGHPVGCAMALAQIRQLEQGPWIGQSALLGRWLLDRLHQVPVPAGFSGSVRGLGLLVGLELRAEDQRPAGQLVVDLCKGMLGRGLIVLPEGEQGNVMGFSPPLTITRQQLARAVTVLENLLQLSQSQTRIRRGRIRVAITQ